MSKTGRYYVISEGRTFCIEPIDNSGAHHSNWGDIDPASKKITGSYGEKHRGSIHENESIITKENGFRNIAMLPPGTSPEGYIAQLIAEGK
jgi:hypothetical protein